MQYVVRTPQHQIEISDEHDVNERYTRRHNTTRSTPYSSLVSDTAAAADADGWLVGWHILESCNK